MLTAAAVAAGDASAVAVVAVVAGLVVGLSACSGANGDRTPGRPVPMVAVDHRVFSLSWEGDDVCLHGAFPTLPACLPVDVRSTEAVLSAVLEPLDPAADLLVVVTRPEVVARRARAGRRPHGDGGGRRRRPCGGVGRPAGRADAEGVCARGRRARPVGARRAPGRGGAPPDGRPRVRAMGADRPPAALWVRGRGGRQPSLRGAGPARRRRRAGALPVLRLQADGGHGRPEPARAGGRRARAGARRGPDGRLVDEGGWPVADLLWHRSPFVGPTIWEALRFPLGTLEDELSRAAARAAADGGRAGYSDVLAWFLLSRLATALAGRSWVADLQGALRELVGPALWLRPDRELLELPVEAQITLLARHRGAEVPMVHALTRRTRALASPYLGALGSFAAVVSWFQAFASHVHAGAGVTQLFPSAAYLGRALERCGRPGQRHAASFEVRAPGPASARLVGVQAAGGALSVWFDPATARVVGRARRDVPGGSRRTPSVVRGAASRRVGVGDVGRGAGVGDQPSRGPHREGVVGRGARRRWRRAVPSAAEELRERWRRVRLPAGLPPLTRTAAAGRRPAGRGRPRLRGGGRAGLVDRADRPRP